jgi:biotin carboxyl carrier protein
MADAFVVTIAGRSVTVTVPGANVVEIPDRGPMLIAPVRATGELSVAIGERTETVFVVRTADTAWLFHNGTTYEATIEAEGQARRRSAYRHGALTSPMPATVVAVNVAPGDRVSAGQILIVLEAMKMELPIRSPAEGVVSAVHCQPGDLVQPNVSLIDLEDPTPDGNARQERA